MHTDAAIAAGRNDPSFETRASNDARPRQSGQLKTSGEGAPLKTVRASPLG